MDRSTPAAPSGGAATEELLHTSRVASAVLERGNKVAEQSLGEGLALVADITGLDGQLQGFLDTLGTIGGISRTLKGIAEQTELLSSTPGSRRPPAAARRRGRSRCSRPRSASSR
jgi:hypothetical protein